jgi:hypothetical protein
MASGLKETIEKVADAINKIGLSKLALTVAILAAGLLWFPDKTLKSVKLLAFRNAHADILPPLFWFCLIFFLVSNAGGVLHFVNTPFRNRSYRKARLEILSKLTPKERGLLNEFFQSQSRTLRLPGENPTVVSLYESGLIWRPAQLVSPDLDRNSDGLTYPTIYKIHDWVWDLRSDIGE